MSTLHPPTIAPPPMVAGPAGSRLPTTTRPYYVLFILVLIFTLNWIDRMILSVLLVPIQRELRLSDTAMGVMSGFGFAMLYAAATMVAARYSDRHNRRNLLALSVTLWSVATSLCGMVTGFGQLMAGRAVVGVAEAGGGAPAYSIISDYFEPRRRALALGIYSGGIYTGIMLSFVVGSFLAERYGWRTTFLLLGPLGLVLALVLRLTVDEPLRGRFEPPRLRSDESVGAALRFLGQQRAYVAAAGGLTITAVTQGAYAAWAPALLIKAHGFSLSQAGLSLGLVLGIAGAAGAFAGGGLSDWLSARNPRVRLYFPAVATLLTTPFFALFCLVSDPRQALVIYAIGTIISAAHFGPAFGLTQNLARPAMRGLATALVMVSTVLTGQGLGPVLTGVLSDALRGGVTGEPLRYALAIMAGFATLGSLLFAYGARFVAEDFKRATGDDLLRSDGASA